MEDAARFHVSWYEESPVKKLSQINILKGRERVAKLEMHMNSSHGGSEFRLGKTVGVNIVCRLVSNYKSLVHYSFHYELLHCPSNVFYQLSKTYPAIQCNANCARYELMN